MRLFLDANILFTALHNPTGKAALIIELGIQGHWELFSHAYALEEARRNLERQLPHALEGLGLLHDSVHLVQHRVDLGFLEGLAEKDQPIFQAALACQATHLLTGDFKDFGSFMNQPQNTFGICIQTVTQFLNHFA